MITHYDNKDDKKNNLSENLNNKTSFELFPLFIDDEVFDIIIEETNRYSQQETQISALSIQL